MVHQGFNIFNLVLFAAIGNTLGAVFNYWVGIKGNHFIMERLLKISQEMQYKATKLFDKYGIFLLFFAWLPVIGDPITLVAGLMRYNFVGFLILVSMGENSALLFISSGCCAFLSQRKTSIYWYPSFNFLYFSFRRSSSECSLDIPRRAFSFNNLNFNSLARMVTQSVTYAFPRRSWERASFKWKLLLMIYEGCPFTQLKYRTFHFLLKYPQ